MLWLQRAWSTDLPAAVRRGFENVDVYKTNAKLIFSMISGARSAPVPGAAFNIRENPERTATVRAKRAQRRKPRNGDTGHYRALAKMG